MFEPVNRLEESLVNAAKDPSCRPQFFRDLLAADVFIINHDDSPLDIEDGTLQTSTKISIRPWSRDGIDWLPMFSSEVRLEQSITSQVTVLQINAKTFFEITKGANVILNPNLEYGKAFPAEEIESILDGSLFSAGTRYTVERQTQILLGQPAEYPQDLVDALGRLFAKTPTVKAAYLAHLFNPDRDEPSHNVIGIELTGDWDAVVGAAGIVVRDVLPANTLVDFIRIEDGDSSISDYLLKQTKPFYKKSFVQRLFGSK